MNENSFPSANGGAYNLSEIWQVPINGGGESSVGGRLELHRPPFVADLSHFVAEAAVAANRDVAGNDLLGGVGGGGGGRKRRDPAKEEEEAARGVSSSSANAMNDNMSKRLKTLGSGGENQHTKEEDEGNTGKGTDKSEPLQDYIHVRARRGQATDSHSLAERARREKISDRMKTLQDLVPGCNKVIGKAMVLDEIINYVQSLQQQVEFLSMKLETVNSRMNVGLEGYPLKNFGQQAGFDHSGGAYGSQTPEEHVRGSSPEWLHMQVGSGFER